MAIEKFEIVLTLLLASFKASAKGCKIPCKETLLGPCRLPVSLRIFRSARVMNATDTKTGRMIIKVFKSFKINISLKLFILKKPKVIKKS